MGATLKKIGILDSGIGGLTILKDLIGGKYCAEYFYISDEDNVPYGGKTQDFMLERTRLMVEKLRGKDIYKILIACNTLTAETIEILRKDYIDINFIGIEPYVNYINKNSMMEDDSVGMILTPATFESERFKNLIKKYDPNGKIIIQPLNSLALLIQQLSSKPFKDMKDLIDQEIQKIKDHGSLTHVILGCTHYPIIRKYIEDSIGVKTIDPYEQVIDHLVSICDLEVGQRDTKFFFNPNLGDEWNFIGFDSLDAFKLDFS